MDVIAQLEDTSVPFVLKPTMQAFEPLLEHNRARIEGVERRTFKYGSTDRHQLDVYYPPTASPSHPPILVYLYGGGFHSGHRVFPPPHDLIYRNLGAFFASRGILTVIPDYRVVPNATYPEPAEDSAAAIKWVVEYLAGRGDTERLVLMGHSAGAAIVSTVLLHEPSLLDEDLKRRIKGAILVGGPHHHNGRLSIDPSVIQHYYGTPEQLATRVPFALLGHASDDTIAKVPKLLLVVSEKDPELVLTAHADFTKLARERLGENSVSTRVALGHNHISLTWAPSSGEGEEWAEDVVMWVKGA